MDQRPDQLEKSGWLEDRPTTLPRAGERITAADTDEYEDNEKERIKADIEDTRAEMGQTINEIQERLSPEHLMDQVKETVREATIGKVERVMDRVGEKISNVTEPAMEAMGRAGETIKQTGSSLSNTVRQNPIPCALIGLGLGMFVMRRLRGGNGSTSRSRAYQPEFEAGMAMPRSAGMGRQYDSSNEYAGGSRQYGSRRGPFGQMKETAGDWAQGTADTVSNLGHGVKEQALRAGRGFQHLIEENPLAVGAAAVAVGAVVGLALPTTRIEHEYMGEASEKLVDKAQQVARDAMDKVKTATQGDAAAQGSQPGQSQPAKLQPGQSQPAVSQMDMQQVGQQPKQHQQTGQSQSTQSQQPGQKKPRSQPGQSTPNS